MAEARESGSRPIYVPVSFQNIPIEWARLDLRGPRPDAPNSRVCLRSVDSLEIGHKSSHWLAMTDNHDFFPSLYTIKQSVQRVSCLEGPNLGHKAR
jgi:hypothetical protein